MDTPQRDDLIGIREAATVLGLKLGTLQLRLHRSTFPFPPVRKAVGGNRYFVRSDIESLVTRPAQELLRPRPRPSVLDPERIFPRRN